MFRIHWALLKSVSKARAPARRNGRAGKEMALYFEMSGFFATIRFRVGCQYATCRGIAWLHKDASVNSSSPI